NRKAIFEALQKAGIQVSTIGTGQAYVDEGLSFSSPDPVIRQQAVQRIKDQIQLAKELNAKVIIGTIKGKMPENPEDKVIARKWVVDCLRECTACAESFKTQLTLEAVNRYETNFLNTAQETVEFIEEVGSSAMGLHLDTFHMNIEEVSMEAALRTYAKYLIHVHVADSNRWAPGMGHLDFPGMVKTLREINYQGVLAVECLPKPEPLIAAKQALSYFRSII
ncbi:MAG TPA: sugar phosphate isomerase/epimerase family protein, partial [Bacillota bacterium]|nr:sugar phosphate isomerase/epimerase family protein [Bacillota bacterium]